ncbi:MAG: glycerol-3-phosphate 1-O-acyltransferase PlsY, partial [Fidelibacterota bacterium]
MLSLILIVISGYLVGSIPTSIIAGKLLRGIDIRKHGSGNAGATNVFRVLGPKPGIAVMLIDIGKGVLATLVISSIRVDPVPLSAALVQIIAGLSAVSGHIWTIFARFRGGKGVGTAAGMVFSLFPIAALICLGVFVVIVISTRYVSIASMSSAVALPLS